jgi:circadian clock protein KaiC
MKGGLDLMSTIRKVKTFISGFDTITYGGLPEHRISLVVGKQGCGKSVFGYEFLVNGARYAKEPGLLVSFEETEKEILENIGSFHWQVEELLDKGLLSIAHIPIDRQAILESGDYNLDGLFIQLEQLIKKNGARRVVLDTIETIFGGFQNHTILRAELIRLFRWLKDKKVTSVITAEQEGPGLTRFHIEEFVSDCVIQLQLNERQDVLTRKLVVLKYRGSKVGMNIYPFLIDEGGISLLPVTNVGLNYQVSEKYIKTGVPILDEMLGGKGIYEGSIFLLSGNAGTGKTTFAGSFALENLENGKKVLYVSTEESSHQLLRNFSSLNIDLKKYYEKKQLYFYSEQPSFEGLEEHLIRYRNLIEEFQPEIFILDPVSNLITIGEQFQVRVMLTRFIDFLRNHGITAMFVDFNQQENIYAGTKLSISSMVDTWAALYNRRVNGKFKREIVVIKSRGMSHVNESRPFYFTSQGIQSSER